MCWSGTHVGYNTSVCRPPLPFCPVSLLVGWGPTVTLTQSLVAPGSGAMYPGPSGIPFPGSGRMGIPGREAQLT